MDGMSPADFQRDKGEWAEKTFPQSTKAGIVEHLKTEVDELLESNAPEEGADCLLLLLHHAHKCGYDLYEEARKKHEINKTRKWGAPNEKGFCEHVK